MVPAKIKPNITIEYKLKPNITIKYKLRENSPWETVKVLSCAGKATGKY